jgi:hypothetical protein
VYNRQDIACLSNLIILGGKRYMVYIDKVRYTTDQHGCEVITHLKWTNNLYESASKECTKQQMINFIKQNPNCTKTKYIKLGLWSEGEDVRVVENSYLRTDANDIKRDNLGALPRY